VGVVVEDAAAERAATEPPAGAGDPFRREDALAFQLLGHDPDIAGLEIAAVDVAHDGGMLLDDGEAADYIVNEKSRLKGVLTPGEIKMLSERIGNFDFDAALKCISGIASRLSLNLEGK